VLGQKKSIDPKSNSIKEEDSLDAAIEKIEKSKPETKGFISSLGERRGIQ
jgi:hypothetical protein